MSVTLVREMPEEDLGPWIWPDQTLRRLSATRVQLFDVGTYGGCERRFWAEYVGTQIAGMPHEPEMTYQKVGTEVHAQIERFLKTGVNTLQDVALSGMHFIPQPGPDLAVEHPIITLAQLNAKRAVLQPHGVPFSGKIDLFHRRSQYLSNEGVRLPMSARTAELMDWKSTSSIEKYAKTGPQLIDNIQMMTYAEYITRLWPDLEWIRLSHGYFQTRGRKYAEKRSVIVDLTTVKRVWERIERIVLRMTHVVREREFTKVEPNYSSCNAYTGCPRRTLCPRSPKQVLIDLLKPGGAMSLVDRLREQQQANGANGASFGPPPFAPQSQFAPQGYTQAPAPAPQAPWGPPIAPPQITPQVQQHITALEDEERRLKGQTPQYAQQAPPMQVQPQYAPQSQAPWGPQAPVAPPQQAPWAPQAPPPQEQVINYGQCQACGAALSNQNASRLQDNSIRHIACPRLPAQVLPPDAPFSQPHLAAHPIAPESLPMMPQSIQQANAQHFGAPQQPPQFGAQPQPQYGAPFAAQIVEPPKGDKCRASGITIAVTPEQAMRRAMLCPGSCGKTIQLKPEQVGGQMIAKIKRHHLDVLPGAQGAAPMGGATPQTPAAPEGLTLYLDVSITGVQAVDLEQYVNNCCGNLAQQYQAPDIRSAPQDSPLGYGRWRGVLAAMVRAFPPNGVCVLNGAAQSDIKQVVVEALRPMAKIVIAGQK